MDDNDDVPRSTLRTLFGVLLIISIASTYAHGEYGLAVGSAVFLGVLLGKYLL